MPNRLYFEQNAAHFSTVMSSEAVWLLSRALTPPSLSVKHPSGEKAGPSLLASDESVYLSLEGSEEAPVRRIERSGRSCRLERVGAMAAGGRAGEESRERGGQMRSLS